jgi:hypothetical protein
MISLTNCSGFAPLRATPVLHRLTHAVFERMAAQIKRPPVEA